MRKKMLVIVVVPIIAALVAGVVYFSMPLASSAMAATWQPGQFKNQAIEEEDDDAGEQDDDENEVEDETIDPALESQVQITPEEAGGIAANHLSVDAAAVREIELEQEGGEIHYSIAVAKGSQIYDVEVNAIDGSVGTVELDD